MITLKQAQELLEEPFLAGSIKALAQTIITLHTERARALCALQEHATKCAQDCGRLATRTMWFQHGPLPVCDDPECITEHHCDRCGGEDREPLAGEVIDGVIGGKNCQYCGLGLTSHPVVVAKDPTDLPYADLLREINKESPK